MEVSEHHRLESQKISTMMETNAEKQKKIYQVNETLKDYHSKLKENIQSRIPLENLTLIGNFMNLHQCIISFGVVIVANAVVDDPNVLEIVIGLRDCQRSMEELLKKKRDSLILAHQKEIEDYTRTLGEDELAHTIQLVRVQHENKLREMDKKIMDDLDGSVTEQQQCLQQLNIPGFYVTMDTLSIITQMHLFSFLLKLQKGY